MSLVGIFVLAVVSYAFVRAERFVYFWDFSGYWVATIRLGELLSTPGAAMEAVFESVRHDKYNLLAAIPLAPISRVFDDDRTAWVLTILVVYGLPAVYGLVVLVGRLDRERSRAAAALAAAVVVLSPALWAPMLRGAVGIGGVGLAVVLWLAYGTTLREIPIRRAIVCGVLLTVLVLFRRWYAFWAVGFLAALAIEALVQPRNPGERRAAAIVFGVTAAASCVALFAIATPIAISMITADPAADRAAYRAPSFYLDGLLRIGRHFGVLPLLLAACGLGRALRNPQTRSLARLVAVQTVVVLVLFLRTQRFDRHHYYLLAPQVVVFASVFLAGIARRAGGGRVVAGACVAVMALGFGAAFSPGVAASVGNPGWLFGAPRYAPYTRDDLPEVVRLAEELDARTRDAGGKIYVLASYVLLNEDILRNAHRTTEAPDLSDRVLLSAHLDLREPFPSRLFEAEYVVVTDPVRLHLPPSEQEVISIPARQILAGEGIGASFRRLPVAFTLEDGTEVGIWRRKTPVPADAREELRSLLARDS